MAKRNGAAARIDPRIIVGKPQLCQTPQHLGRKCLVDFDDIDLVKRDPGAIERAPDRRHRSQPHDPGVDPGHRAGQQHGQG